MKEKLYLSGVTFYEDEKDRCKVYLLATPIDPDFEKDGYAMGISLEFHLVRDTTDIDALEKKAIAKAQDILKKLLLP